VVRDNNGERACLNISKEAKLRLDEIRHIGQSYDGLIRELVINWKEQQGSKETVRRPLS
jgi:hypothetical protein